MTVRQAMLSRFERFAVPRAIIIDSETASMLDVFPETIDMFELPTRLFDNEPDALEG